MRKLTALLAAGLVLGMSGMAMATTTATGTMTTSATLTNSCIVSNATMTFPSSAALLSTSDQTADTGTTLTVACTTGTTPKIWSDTTRTLSDGAGSPKTFAFKLSQTSGAVNDDLPITTGAAEAIAAYTADGSEIIVPLYGKIMAANFGNKPANTYTASITVKVDY